MKTLKRWALAAAVCAAGAAGAQERDTVVVDQAEVILTVTDVDRQARAVTFRNPQGRVATVTVPPEAQNLDQVSPGARFKLRYVESVAVALSPEGEARATVEEKVRLAPKGGTPGGMVARTAQVSGVIEQVDYAGRRVTLRGPEGNVVNFKVAENVRDLERVRVGNAVSVAVTEALALDMIPMGQP
jgi:hypothetical protein